MERFDEPTSPLGLRTAAHVRPAGWLAICFVAWFVTAPPALAETGACDASAPLFTHWRSLTSGLTGEDPFAAGVRAQRRHLRLMAPVAVAARGNDVYVVDAMQNLILRFDLGLGTLSRIAAWRGSPLGVELIADRDLTIYLLDPIAGSITQFSRDGVPMRVLGSESWPGRPTALVPDPANGGFLVADGLAPQIVAYDGLGAVTGTLGGDAGAPLPVARIDGLAAGRDSLYLLNRAEHEVQVVSRAGAPLGRFGAGDLHMPVSIAVDAHERVLIADAFDNQLKLFVDGVLVASEAGGGGVPGKFREIRDVWVDGELVYVCDTVGARIEIMRLEPPCP